MAAATDAENNYYVSGYFNRSARFGTNFLSSPYPCDAYLAKYYRQMNWLWVRQINRQCGGQRRAIAAPPG